MFVLFDFVLGKEKEAILFATILIILGILFYFSNRDIKYIELGADKISIKYYSATDKKDEIIPLSQIITIEIYLKMAFNAATLYHIVKSNGETAYMDSHYIRLTELEKYCYNHDIKIEKISKHDKS